MQRTMNTLSHYTYSLFTCIVALSRCRAERLGVFSSVTTQVAAQSIGVVQSLDSLSEVCLQFCPIGLELLAGSTETGESSLHVS